MKVLVKAPFSPYSGYGNDGIGIVKALLLKGHDVYLQPTHVDAPLPEYLARLLLKRLEAPFDLAIVHVDPVTLYAAHEMRQACDYVLGWTMWEFSAADNIEKEHRKKFKENYKDFDAIVGYDEISHNALAPYIGKSTASFVQQGGYWPDEWREVERDWFSERFGFCMNGQLVNQRKNTFLAIDAYDELKQEHSDFEGAELHLHTNRLGLHPLMEKRYHHLRIHYETWPKNIMEA